MDGQHAWGATGGLHCFPQHLLEHALPHICMRVLAQEEQIGARHKTINFSPESPLRVKLGKILFTTISLEAGNVCHQFFSPSNLRVRGGSLKSLTHSPSAFEITGMRSRRNHLLVTA